MLGPRSLIPPGSRRRQWWLLLWGVAWLAVGCSVQPAPECRQLLDCAQVLVPGAAAELRQVYGADGGCWKDRAAARRCTQSCREALEGLRSEPGFGATRACQP